MNEYEQALFRNPRTVLGAAREIHRPARLPRDTANLAEGRGPYEGRISAGGVQRTMYLGQPNPHPTQHLPSTQMGRNPIGAFVRVR